MAERQSEQNEMRDFQHSHGELRADSRGGFTAASLGDIAGAVTDGLAGWVSDHADSPTAYDGYSRNSH